MIRKAMMAATAAIVLVVSFGPTAHANGPGYFPQMMQGMQQYNAYLQYRMERDREQILSRMMGSPRHYYHQQGGRLLGYRCPNGPLRPRPYRCN